ncbi:MAG: M23 family metallopeptidase [Pseudomonadota bacterium]
MIRAAALMLTLAPVQAGAVELSFPLDCTLGDTCFIQQYVDRDPGPQAADFTCGARTYDGHSGTDIAVPSDAAMIAGVSVLAAAPGTVKGMRDGVIDIRVSDPAAPPLNGRDCGNGVVIDHGQGWETQYCHMKQGSVLVRKGDVITTGQPLGQVGLSGNTQFPHVHISVRRDGAEVDPFAPDLAACGAPPARDLWTADIPYAPGGVITVGLASAVPEFDAIKAGLPPEALTARSPALVLWAYYYGNRAGDQLQLTLTGPQGVVLEETTPLDRTQAQAFRASGKRLTAAQWPAGSYSGTATLIRDGAALDSASLTLTLQ